MPSRSSRSTKKRQEIHRAAAKLFAQRGEEVALGRGALYHHIKSKEALLFEVSSAYLIPAMEFAEQLAGEDAPADEKLRRLSYRLMEAISENIYEGTVFLAEHRFLTGEYRTQIVEIRDRFERACVEIMEQGVAQGIFREVDPIAIKGMLGMYNHSYIWLRPKGRLTPAEIADVFYEIILKGVKHEV
jgi:AcrR family transcriptional regulator